MATLICPTCERPFDSDKSACLPFCSVRCQQIDLARWLDEKHGLPLEPGEGEGEQEVESE